MHNPVSGKKFSHFHATKGLEFKVVSDSFDQIFVLSNHIVDDLMAFLKENKIEENLSIYSMEENLKLIKNLKNQYQMKHIDNVNFVDELPYRLYDYDWLANYILMIIKRHEHHFPLKPNEVKKFIQESSHFNAARNEYINGLAKKLIVKNMNYSKTNVPARSRRVYAYEEIFRNKILCGMCVLGLDPFVSELAIENNADLWRTQNMVRAFNEHYYVNDNFFKNDERWQKFRTIHLKKWLKCRESEYYFNHANVFRNRIF